MKFEQVLESPISKYSILYFFKKAFESLSIYDQIFVENLRFPVFRTWMNMFSFENLKSSSRVRKFYEMLTVLWISKNQNIETCFSWKNAFESSSAHERAVSAHNDNFFLQKLINHMVIFMILWLFRPKSNILSHV